MISEQELSKLQMQNFNDLMNDSYYGEIDDTDTFNLSPTKEQLFNIRTIRADLDNQSGVSIQRNFKSNNEQVPVNEIDLECNCCEDDFEYEIPSQTKKEVTYPDDIVYFDDEDDYNFEPPKSYNEYMDEIRFQNKDVIQEKKSENFGKVTNDYWEKLAKKHSKTNVKGAYNNHFHFAANPEREMELLNHDLTPQGKAVDGEAGAIINATGSASTNAVSAGASEGCCEDVQENKYQKLYEDLLFITGFEVDKNDDGTYDLNDECNLLSTKTCKDGEELLNWLSPYIGDALFYSLENNCGEKFNNCVDWYNWYTPEMQKKYPKCKDDIAYCDLVANHWKDICY